jgi:prephenate dehydrogenase
MATISVGILGLGRLGASVGLAIKRAQKANPRQQFTVIGYDTNSANASVARAKGACDSLAGSANEAVTMREIVVITMPYADVRETYRQIAPALKAGAVVLDMSPLVLPSMDWAKQSLKPEQHMAALHPILNPAYLFDGRDDLDHAAEDLFDRGAMLIMPSPTCAKEAVELAADFSEILGAQPRFVDPYEHDGWIAAMEGLPALLAAASFYMLRATEGWDDAQRAGNPNFGRLTHHLADTHPDDLRDMLLNNRENMIRQIDSLTDVLGALRAAFAANDRAAIEEALISSRDAYAYWLDRRERGEWDDSPGKNAPQYNAGEMMMAGMLGGYLAKRLRRGD